MGKAACIYLCMHVCSCPEGGVYLSVHILNYGHPVLRSVYLSKSLMLVTLTNGP